MKYVRISDYIEINIFVFYLKILNTSQISKCKKKRLQMVSNEYPKLKMNLLYLTYFSPLGFKRLLKNSQKIYRGL